ncbi:MULTISPECIES: hypothetical protein [unclassified Streptomyces]|uniref:hypothetical protein n=1 Tax=unclassified Streptomyces TaxID=2593676 RepID=UPI0033A6039C
MTARHTQPQPQPGEPELTPSRMPAFVRDLVDATTSARRAQSLAPLRTFVHTWGVFVAIQRYPSEPLACVTWKTW